MMNTEENNVHVKGLTGELRHPTKGMFVILENDNSQLLRLLDQAGERVVPKQTDTPKED